MTDGRSRRVRPVILGVLTLLWGLTGPAACAADGSTSKPQNGEEEVPMALHVTSTAFEPGQSIPQKYTGEGPDVSPQLSWSGAPDGTAAFAVICDDPDAPTATPWVHWVLYHIPADRTSLAEGDRAGATEGKTDFGHARYGGPMPPKGHGVHHYHFKVYALDRDVDLGPGATKDELLAAMEGHVLAQGELLGTYERK